MFKVGDRVTFVSDDEMYKAGDVPSGYDPYRSSAPFIVTHVTNDTVAVKSTKNNNSWTFCNRILRQLVETVAYLKKRRDDLEAEVEAINNKINMMEELGVESISPTEEKAFAILKALKKTASDIEKAKAIAKVIDG